MRVSHTVLPGETIASIAQSYGVSIQDIAASNQLQHFQQLPVGMALVIDTP
ncbi:MAG: LysM peptidoglycan-binding domain-containing protein [Anaerolineae bacterium]|jgi:LysM repeat protein|nr:LysM peptidoglycan-binding domain-containing protein [Anaerolineae bacterium]